VSHVALVIPGLDRIGGAERQVMLVARGLRRRGWRVSMVALSGSGGEARRELETAGVAFLALAMRKGLADPRGWVRFQGWLRRERPDVVHAHLPHAAWLTRWSRLGAAIPAVVDTLHSSFTGTAGRRWGYRLSDWLPEGVTAVSQAVADLRARMVSTEKLTVLPNGIDTDVWRPDAQVRAVARSELGWGEEFVWVAAGRLEAVKDYPTLIEAMVRVPEPSRLLIAGAGPLDGELARLAARLGVRDRMRFLGFQPEVQRWMQAADGFVLASRWEGLPMALLEAAACGLPIVATDVPGTREAVEDGRTGRLAKAGNPEQLAAAMTATMRDSRENRRAMGTRARERVIEEFGLEAVLDRWERLYGELPADCRSHLSAISDDR
jgi:glycosyltransferase involved in cell wall biosynthesis